MKKGDLAAQHRLRIAELHTAFRKKTQYHSQKAYLEIKDLYWLVHEFFTTFLQKDIHYTEEELVSELIHFKHDFMTIPQEVIEKWRSFFGKLSASQYAGNSIEQESLKKLVQEFGELVDQTLGKEYTAQDSFTKQIQSAQVYVKHNEIEKAEQLYKRLMTEYDSFNAEKKKEHYEQLEHLYQSIVDVHNA